MNRFLYLFFLLLAVVGRMSNADAQIVNIPDANFKAKLISEGVDTNNDGEIQTTEAQAVDSLYVGNSFINNMTGIEAFLNLTYLACYNNQLVTLNVSNCTSLMYLSCGGTQLTSLDISNCTNLTQLSCPNNQLTNLDVSNNVALTNLVCSTNQLTSLDVSNCPDLISLACNTNQLTFLNVSNNANLTTLGCGANLLTNLNISNCTALTFLYCYTNQLTNLDVSNCTALTSLSCYTNQLTNLNISNCTSLAYLICVDNQLTSLDVSNNAGLVSLWCYNNQLTNLDMTNNNMLIELICYNNPLTSLALKNGSIETALDFSNNPMLNYLCIDPAQFSNIQTLLQQYGMTNVFVSTLCTYTPGGNYNTLSGQIKTDLTLNGCTIADSAYSFIPIAINDGSNTYYTCANQQGNYIAYLDSGNFSLAPQVANPVYYSVNTATISFPNNNNNLQTQDFCITPNGSFPDVEITFIPVNPARPGFNANYQILYKNIGTTAANGDITLDFQGNKMSFLTASVSPASQIANQLTWNYSNLQPFESRIITLTMNILPPPTNNIGEVLHFDANISLTNDNDASNNVLPLNQTLVGAYDPNDKTCLEGKLVDNDKIGDYLHYMVRFQNTGTAPAENVVVVDTLNAAKYDLTSLQIIETSHDAHIDLKGNVLQFYFENIQLADSFSNEPASHGFVVYKIKTKSTLPQNSSVSNKAEIYFDYNLPVITNLETTTFTNFVGIEDAIQATHFQCYPNPAQNTLTIETEKSEQFSIFNLMGEVVKKVEIKGKETVDISALPKGIYFLKGKNQSKGISFVKE